jgi:hypothetical protein
MTHPSNRSCVLDIGFITSDHLKSRHHGIKLWKTSGLAVLAGFDKETRDELGDIRPVSETVKVAEEIRKTMSRGDQGWSLSLSE